MANYWIVGEFRSGENVEGSGFCFSCVNTPTFSWEGPIKTMETSVRKVGVRDKNHGRHKSEHTGGNEILSVTCITK